MKSPQTTLFLMKDFLSNTDYKKISNFIGSISQQKLFILNETVSDHEIEIDSLDIESVYETVYTDQTFQWIIYESHELTIAFGGKELIQYIQELFSDRPRKTE